jgi:hypothetical protein
VLTRREPLSFFVPLFKAVAEFKAHRSRSSKIRIWIAIEDTRTIVLTEPTPGSSWPCPRFHLAVVVGNKGPVTFSVEIEAGREPFPEAPVQLWSTRWPVVCVTAPIDVVCAPDANATGSVDGRYAD